MVAMEASPAKPANHLVKSCDILYSIFLTNA